MDCIEGIKLIDNNSIDLIVTSPPYNLGNFSRNGGKNVYSNYNGNDMKEPEYRSWLSTIIKLCIPKIKNSGYFAINIKYRYKDNHCILPHWILDSFNPLILRNEIIWNYVGYTDVNNSKFYPGHEVIFLFSKAKDNFIFDKEYSKLGDVWYISQASLNNEISASDHPAPFPIEVPLRIIKGCTNKNSMVFDPFMGSGTTAVACVKSNRNFIGFEISQEFCELAKKRISKYQTTKSSPILNTEIL